MGNLYDQRAREEFRDSAGRPTRLVSPIVEEIRELAAYRAEESSVRSLANIIGINHNSLHTFLRGGNPYAKTLRCLRSWYASETGSISAEESALDVIFHDMAPGWKRGAKIDLCSDVAQKFTRVGMTTPPWIARLRAKLAALPATQPGDEAGHSSESEGEVTST